MDDCQTLNIMGISGTWSFVWGSTIKGSYGHVFFSRESLPLYAQEQASTASFNGFGHHVESLRATISPCMYSSRGVSLLVLIIVEISRVCSTSVLKNE